MNGDPHDDDAIATVLAGLGDIYLHVDALHQRCISFLNGGGGDEFQKLLIDADEVLRVVLWLGSDSLAFLRGAGAIRSSEAMYPRVAADIPEVDYGYDDEPRKAIASLEGAIGEVEQQVYGLVHSGDIDAVDVRQIQEALLLIGHLTTIALERVETIQNGSLPRPAGLDKAAS